MNWQWCRLGELSALETYSVLAARETVFVVEQHCPYQELDGLDYNAHHLIAWQGTAVAAYLRVVEPGAKFAEPSIGRVLTAKSFRRQGLGRELMQRALDQVAITYLGLGIRISAQTYLDAFYRSFGFIPCSAHYLDDDIPHVDMRRP